MSDTSITVPGVSLREILWFVELSKAVLDAHVFRAIFYLVLVLKIGIFVLNESVETTVERPAAFSVELNGDFELVTDGLLEVFLVGATAALRLLTSYLFLLLI